MSTAGRRAHERTQAMKSAFVWNEPDYSQTAQSRAAGFTFYIILLLFGSFSALACFYTVFPLTLNVGAVVFTLTISAAGAAAMFLSPAKPRRVALLSLLGTGAAAFLLFRKDLTGILTDGALRAANTAIDVYSKSAAIDFEPIPVEEADAAAVIFNVTFLAVIITIIMTLLLGYFLIVRKSAFLCFLTTVPFPVAAFAYTIIPHPAAMISMGTFWLFLFTCVAPLRRRSGFAAKKRVFYGEGQSAARIHFLLLIPLLALCLLVTLAAFPREGLPRMPYADELRNGVTSGRIGYAMFHVGGVAGSVSRVDLRHAGVLRYTGDTALRVRTDAQIPNYLKGFVGSVYTGSGWEPLSDEDSDGLKGVLGGHMPQNYPALIFELMQRIYSEDITEIPVYTFEIENLKINPRNVYSPYGLAPARTTLSGIEFVNDGYLRAENRIFGIEGYTLRAYDLPPAEMYRYFESDWQNWDFIPDYMRDYTEFVKTEYTRLPEAAKSFLDKYRMEHDLEAEYTESFLDEYQAFKSSFPPDYLALVQEIVTQVQSENKYTRSPGDTPEDRDFVEYFLSENHKGYCVHFASAVVALLRSAGIPARYAEGFVVTPGDKRDSDGWVNLADSRAHAWAEIYLEGLGWVPVEATPGRQSGVAHPLEEGIIGGLNPDEAAVQTNEAVLTEGGVTAGGLASGGAATGSATNGAASGAAANADGGTSGGGAGAGDGTGTGSGAGALSEAAMSALVTAIIISLCILCFIFAVRVNRRNRLAEREKLWSGGGRSIAVLSIYDYILRLLLLTGKIKSGGAEDSEIQAAKLLPKAIVSTAQKARFSNHSPTDEELNALRKYAKFLAQKTEAEIPAYQKAFARYILTLF